MESVLLLPSFSSTFGLYLDISGRKCWVKDIGTITCAGLHRGGAREVVRVQRMMFWAER